MGRIIRNPEDWDSKWENFKFEEFTCKCGCGLTEVSSDMLDLLQTAREDLNQSIGITSGYRCPEHNAKVSSTGREGPHTRGAVDIHVSNSQHRKELIDYFAKKVSGLGIAKTFIHIDLLTYEHGFNMRPNAWIY